MLLARSPHLGGGAGNSGDGPLRTDNGDAYLQQRLLIKKYLLVPTEQDKVPFLWKLKNHGFCLLSEQLFSKCFLQK